MRTSFIVYVILQLSVFACAENSATERFQKVTDRVKKGRLIGLCGNSGNSSEPHLHYHLQNTPIIRDGTGIKCYFQKLTLINGGQKELKTNYSPIKGQIILAE